MNPWSIAKGITITYKVSVLREGIVKPNVKALKLLLWQLPKSAQEVVMQVVDSDPDVESVGGFDDQVDLLLAVLETNADVVVLPMISGEEQGLLSHLRAEYPHLVILGVNSGSKTGYIEQLGPTRRVISELNSKDLPRALREAVLSARALSTQIRQRTLSNDPY